MRYFVAVAQELHFGRAAQKLHIAQPPLSQQIRRLEEIVGCILFQRTSRSVRLTPAGEALLESAQRTLTRVGEDLDSVRSIARGEVGSLSVGFVSSAMLADCPMLLAHIAKGTPRFVFPCMSFIRSNSLRQSARARFMLDWSGIRVRFRTSIQRRF